jgi:hypothetical protein
MDEWIRARDSNYFAARSISCNLAFAIFTSARSSLVATCVSSRKYFFAAVSSAEPLPY